jgi:hypothetical protein
VTAGTGTLLTGDIITIVGVNSVHPETKVDNGVLQQFVITADYAGGAGNITVSPTPITSGAKQNVVINSAGSGKAVVIAGTASGQDTTSLLYQQDAFTFATADLVMPNGVDFARREVQDGISLRIVRAYDINNDNLPCRIDVLVRLHAAAPRVGHAPALQLRRNHENGSRISRFRFPGWNHSWPKRHDRQGIALRRHPGRAAVFVQPGDLFLSLSTNVTVPANLTAIVLEIANTLIGLGIWKGS